MPAVRCCPQCKRPFPPEIQVGGIIRQRIFDYVKDHPAGVTTSQIINHVWQDDPNGGPGSSDIVSTTIWHINCRLREHRMYIRGSGGAGSVYKLFGM